ncbi:hypothetical protein AYL99_12015 [Fonsecaea erecta]|uniref:F-box domain-containing protein n=1 Tax=Fonsecaea erecta TaxID=1367422 RepID=A0A178Z308_9EURO|nr:hypothetical protein AYL99_12015 [Fonsecaea erecta]OAP53796.1 hypothetical protein AYL99_12015 [Fonsecaea erecta]
MPPTGIEGLPDEMLLEIAKLLANQGQQDICHFSLCSKRTLSIGTPELYRNVQLTGTKSVSLLLRSFSCSKDLTDRVRSLSVEANDDFEDDAQSDHTQGDHSESDFVRDCLPLLPPDRTIPFLNYLATRDEGYKYSIQEGLGEEYRLALLVLQLSKLTELSLNVPWTPPPVVYLMKFALQKKLFVDLSKITIDSRYDEERVAISPFLLQPSLKTFKSSGLAVRFSFFNNKAGCPTVLPIRDLNLASVSIRGFDYGGLETMMMKENSAKL